MKCLSTIISLLLCGFFLLVNGSRDSILCNVVENTSNQNMPCQFPFILSGKTHHTCTVAQDPEGKAWCSTRVTDREIHIGSMGYWGHCSEECLSFRSTEKEIFESGEGAFLDESKTCNDCRNFRDCPWSLKMFELLGSLDKDSSARRRFINFLRAQKCDGGPRNVCCGSEPENPTDFSNSVDISGSENKDLGTWKPRPEKNECGKGTDPIFVIGGQEAKIGGYPFMALLGYDSPIECTEFLYVCGGALINKHYVVTAAHCITDAPSQIRDVVLGGHDVVTDPDCRKNFCAPKVQRFKAEKIITHERWNPRRFTDGNDIALIRLDKPAILASEDISASFLVPICLPWLSTDLGRNLSDGESTIVAGWGEITNNFTASSVNYCSVEAAVRTLQQVTLPISSYEKCNDAYRLIEVNNTQQMCAGGELDKDSCNSDSGGPLIYKANDFSETPMFQVGIVSFGTRPCGIRKPGIYTRISSFLEWIKDNLEP
uniref:Serine protease easter n=1 Tax=Caligus rogercresseyi TaxID=217165 RepID=C1BMV3_CALRO|nr:Serine protease easter precursor [Caligus rogercresseyi]